MFVRMGAKYEVNAWVLAASERSERRYAYEQQYYGPSLVRAVWAMIQAKRAGSGCVKLEWR